MTAAAPVAVAAAARLRAAATPAVATTRRPSFDVVLTAGDKKIGVIKEVRAHEPGLGSQGPGRVRPRPSLEACPKEEAEKAKEAAR